MIDKKVLSIWKVDVPFPNDPLKKSAFVDNIFSLLQLIINNYQVFTR